jgi:type IV secretory pathway VirB10-like protein
MVHFTRPVRSRLLAATAVTMTIAAPLALASTASACWCPTGMHESAPGTETCVNDVAAPTPTPTTETVAPAPTTEAPAPAPVAETPAPAPEETAVIAPAATTAAPVPAAPAAPAPVAPAPAPVAAQATPEVTPVAAEKPASAVKGIHSTGHRTVHKATKKTVVSAASAPVATPAVKATQAAELPFTGMDSGLVGGLGLLLTASGFVLRRRTREPEGTAAP